MIFGKAARGISLGWFSLTWPGIHHGCKILFSIG